MFISVVMFNFAITYVLILLLFHNNGCL